jgi:integrase
MCRTFRLDLHSIRNKAIILLGFAGGFRRSEIVALNVSDLAFESGSLRVTLRRSKTDQEGVGRTIAIMPGENPTTCAVAAVRAWLKAADLEHDGDNPVFRMVRGCGVESLARGADRASIKRQTGLRSDVMLDRYAREANLTVNNSSAALGL